MHERPPCFRRCTRRRGAVRLRCANRVFSQVGTDGLSPPDDLHLFQGRSVWSSSRYRLGAVRSARSSIFFCRAPGVGPVLHIRRPCTVPRYDSYRIYCTLRPRRLLLGAFFFLGGGGLGSLARGTRLLLCSSMRSCCCNCATGNSTWNGNLRCAKQNGFKTSIPPPPPPVRYIYQESLARVAKTR